MARKSRRRRDAEPDCAYGCGIDVQPYRVGAYIRLSAVDRKQKGDSIEMQQAIISAYIDEHDDLELTDTYIDNGLSGQHLARPAFQRMLTDLESGKINCCITKDLSRLGRNAIDTGYYIEKYFPTHHIRYAAVTDNYDSDSGESGVGSSCGGIMVSLKNMVNEAYALDIAHKIRATKQMNIRNGCFVGRVAPYGYLKSEADGHKLVPDDYTAPIVRRMFEMAANGDGVKGIMEWLLREEILPPRRYFHSIGLATEKEARGSIHWSKSVIYALLKNRVYVGDMVQGKSRTASYTVENLPKSEWIVAESTHEGIVSRELFDKVQLLWENNGSVRGKKHDELRAENPLLRKVFCGHCRRTMFRHRGRKTFSFFCNTRQMYGAQDCVPNHIPETALKAALLESLRKQVALFANNISPNVQPADNADLRSIQSELARNRNFLGSLYESLICGDIADTEYKDMKLSYGEKIVALAEQERQIRESARHMAIEAAMRTKAADSIGTIRCADDLTVGAMDVLVEKILVFADKRIEIRFKFTDAIVRMGGAEGE